MPKKSDPKQVIRKYDRVYSKLHKRTGIVLYLLQNDSNDVKVVFDNHGMEFCSASDLTVMKSDEQNLNEVLRIYRN